MKCCNSSSGALAFHNYHDTTDDYRLARSRVLRVTFIPYLCPSSSRALAQKYNYNTSFYLSPNIDFNAYTGVLASRSRCIIARAIARGRWR